MHGETNIKSAPSVCTNSVSASHKSEDESDEDFKRLNE
jgi:hypothetical protein